jgi:hypothetical protein
MVLMPKVAAARIFIFMDDGSGGPKPSSSMSSIPDDVSNESNEILAASLRPSAEL